MKEGWNDKDQKTTEGSKNPRMLQEKRGFYLHLQLPTGLILILSPMAHGFVTPQHLNSKKISPGFRIFNANAFPRNKVTHWRLELGEDDRKVF